MDRSAERITCIMEAIDHGLSAAEVREECPACTLPVPDDIALRHDNMGWTLPDSFADRL